MRVLLVLLCISLCIHGATSSAQRRGKGSGSNSTNANASTNESTSGGSGGGGGGGQKSGSNATASATASMATMRSQMTEQYAPRWCGDKCSYAGTVWVDGVRHSICSVVPISLPWRMESLVSFNLTTDLILSRSYMHSLGSARWNGTLGTSHSPAIPSRTRSTPPSTCTPSPRSTTSGPLSPVRRDGRRSGMTAGRTMSDSRRTSRAARKEPRSMIVLCCHGCTCPRRFVTMCVRVLL